MRDTQAEPPGRGIEMPLWRDLNILVAAFAVMVSLGSMVVFMPLSLLAQAVLPARQGEVIAIALGYALVAGVLAWWWWKHGLSPRQRDPARERRFQWGHRLLAVFNLTLVLMFVLPLLGGLSWLPRMPGLGRVLVVLVSLAPIGMVAGLAMVWSSRGKPHAFADTLPAAQPGSRRPSSAGWSALKPPPPRVPVIAVLLGLVGSSFILYVAAVFGLMGFMSDMENFRNVVLPIAGGSYVLYLSIVIFLYLKRSMASIFVAWAPFLLVMVLLPMLQVIRGLWR